MRTLIALLLVVSAQAAQTIGVSTVATVNTLRTVTVAKDGSGQFTTIQGALNQALPGDYIQVCNGTYNEAPLLTRSGQQDRAIVVTNCAGHAPVIRPPGNVSTSSVRIQGRWVFWGGFEVTGGWHGFEIRGSNNAIFSNWIHDNGTNCANATQYCGQGVLLVSSRDNVVYQNLIERNGLTNYSPSHVHGVYLTDYYNCRCMVNLTVTGNTIQDHGGAAIHAYDPVRRKTNIRIEGNALRRNAHEIVLVQASTVSVVNNTFEHGTYPASDSAFDSLFWLEYVSGLSVSGNHFTQQINGSQSDVIHGTSGLSGLSFQGNTWNVVGYPFLDDAYLNAILP